MLNDRHIVAAQLEHLEALPGLERALGLQAWELSAYNRCLGDPSCDLLVAVSSQGVEGFYLARTVQETAEVLKLGVRLDAQGQGIGSALLERGLEVARRRGCRECFLEVRSSNRRARELYAKQGFRIVGRRRDYYRDPLEDAVVLGRRWASRTHPGGCERGAG